MGMKRISPVLLCTVLLLMGCGNELNQETISEESEENVSTVIENVEDEATNDVAEDVVFEAFLGLSNSSVSAISDIDYTFYGDEDNGSIKKGDSISIDWIKEMAEADGSQWNYYYTYIYPKSESPILALQWTYGNYTGENGTIIFITNVNNELHLTAVFDTLMDEYTSVYLGTNGIVSSQSRPFGRSSGELVLCSTEIIDSDGNIINLFSENIVSGESLIDDENIGDYYTQVYQNSEVGASVGTVYLGDDKYYVLYSYEEDEAAKSRFKQICQYNGLNVLTRADLIPIVNEYISSYGDNLDISKLDENMAEWSKL